MDVSNERPRKVPSLTIGTLVILSGFIVLITTSTNVLAAADNTWIADSPGVASISGNWENGTVTTSQNIYFLSAHTGTCTWDITTEVGNLYIRSGAGTVTQTADMTVSSCSQAGGTLTGIITKTFYCKGSFIKTSGTLTVDVLRLTMMTNGATLTLNGGANDRLYNLTIDANVQTTTALGLRMVQVNAGKTLTLGNSLDALMSDNYCSFKNYGQISASTKTISIYRYTLETMQDRIGNITASLVNIKARSSATASPIYKMASDSVIDGALTVSSDHATYTCTLNLTSHSLTCGAFTLGTRGILKQYGAFTAASFNQSVSSAVFSQGEDVHIEDDSIIWHGTFAGNILFEWTNGGNFTKVNGTLTFDTLSLVMIGVDKTVSFDAGDLDRLYRLTVTNDTTLEADLNTRKLVVEGDAVLSLEADVYVFLYDDTCMFWNNGTINGAPRSVSIYRYETLPTQDLLGNIWVAELNLRARNLATDDVIFYMGSDLNTSATVTVESEDDTYTCTLETNGYNITAGTLNVEDNGTIDLNTSAVVVTNIEVGANGTLNGGQATISLAGRWDSTIGDWEADESSISVSRQSFYTLSEEWVSIVGNPTDRHGLNPVRTSDIIEANLEIDGETRKYIAYDSSNAGDEIRLYYTDDLDGQWTEYTGNPILGPLTWAFRNPHSTYFDGKYEMFLNNLTNKALERWTSLDGITYTLSEEVISIPEASNPGINCDVYQDPINSKWYLYYSCDYGLTSMGVSVISADSPLDFDSESPTVAYWDTTRTITWAGVTYWNGEYIMVYEYDTGGYVWVIETLYSDNAISGFRPFANNPILDASHACPSLCTEGTNLYLFCSVHIPIETPGEWYTESRKVLSTQDSASAATLLQFRTGQNFTLYNPSQPIPRLRCNISGGPENGTVSIDPISLFDDPILDIDIICSNESISVRFLVSGLSPNTGYRVYQDGEVIYQQDFGFDTVTFEATGGGEFEVVAWSAPLYTVIQAAFSYTNTGWTYYFTDKSFGEVTSWVWNFGDGFGSSSQNPKHTYASSGSYSVSLTVYDAEGHSSTATGTIRIVLGPEQPFEKTDEGWALWFSDTLTLRFSAVALLAAGMFIIAAAKFGPEWPLITKSGRVIIGGIMIVVSVYWLVFKDTQLLSVLGLS